MKRSHYCLFYILLALCACAVAQSEGESSVNNPEKTITIEIEHAINDGNFKPRGKITAKSLKFDSKQTPQLSQLQLTNDELTHIKAGSQKDGLYKIRARLNSGEWVQSSTQLIAIVCSNFRDEVKLHVSNNGDLIAISYFTRSPDKTCLSTKQINPSTHLLHTHSTFDTIFQITAGIEDPRPFFEPTQNPSLTQTPGGSAATEQKPEEKSFWQKYWYLLLPGGLLMISNLLSGLAPAEEEQRGRPQQAGGGAAPRKR
eukprot:TRINITY_DN3495_c0_g1_i1.p1 TRINITY_DN3495_c0_g1~~TRINITY_DN3495_c0_g1_i1.p1  ORF type:complete len:257 (-),score=48.09 TRINITY_DN3495_c0_g1_i1:59-829(-)